MVVGGLFSFKEDLVLGGSIASLDCSGLEGEKEVMLSILMPLCQTTLFRVSGGELVASGGAGAASGPNRRSLAMCEDEGVVQAG